LTLLELQRYKMLLNPSSSFKLAVNSGSHIFQQTFLTFLHVFDNTNQLKNNISYKLSLHSSSA